MRASVAQSARAGHTFMTPVFCLGEFWRVVTEPAGYGASAEDALAFLRRWLVTAPLAYPERRFQQRFLLEVETREPRGAAVFDLAIGVVAVQRGATELWTADARFPRLAGLTLYNPLSGQTA